VLIGLGCALVLFAFLALGGGVAALLYFTKKPAVPSVASAAPETPADRVPVAHPEAGPAAADAPAPPPQPQPKAPIKPAQPGGAFPLKELKAASVFINASTATMAATGSGFVVRVQGDTAYVVTNHHVVTPPKENSNSPPPPMWTSPRPPFGPRPPLGPRMPRLPRRGIAFNSPPGPKAELTAVFHSGSQHEQSLPASLVADDADADLAVLKVTGLKDAPRPIECGRAPELAETMPAVAFGFPFGAKLDPDKKNPAVTVTKGAVSALRLGKGGELGEVQLDLDLNPGNSGGPVVDEKGALIGVAYAKVTNSRIGFAVPVHKLNRLLQGRIEPPHTIQSLLVQGRAQLRVLARVADPFGKLRSPALLYGPADELPLPRRGPDGWEKLAGAKSTALTIQGTEAAATLDLAPPADGELKVLVQVSYRTESGQTVYGEPRTLAAKGPPPFVPPPLVPGPAGSPPEFPPAAAAPRQDERIRNGDFTQGLKGFRTAYRHSPADVHDALTFCLARSPREAHRDAAAFGDHTSGDGLMMVVNGGDAVDRPLWGQTVPVRAGAEYTFSLWLASWYAAAPAELEVRVNGKSLGKVVAPARCGEWKQFSAAWRSGPDVQASVEIVNLTRAISGNDFAIDDVSLRGPPPGPAAPPRAAAATTGDPAMDRLLLDLEAVDGAIRKAATDRLIGMKPNQHRAVVARKLAEQLPVVEPFDREPLIRALGVWATAAEVPTLIQLLDSPETHIRNVTLDALGKLRDERAVKPVVRCFKEFNTRWHAEQALKALGPLAETEVLELLGQPERDLWVPAIYVLAEIGTEQSLPTLREASKQFEMKGVAEGAMIAIQKRMRK
jgi:S1-C subfamily serine protease